MFEIGHDLVEISRIKEAMERHPNSFLEKILTEKERQYCQKFHNPLPHIAGRFAGKEAIVKALGVGISKEIGWQDLEILPNEKGKPLVFLSNRVQRLFPGKIQLTISHTQDLASAFAIWQKN